MLDTNVLLDWLVFDNPQARCIGAAIEDGRLCWIGTEAVTQEYRRVLRRLQLRGWSHRAEAALATTGRCCGLVRPIAPPETLRCADGDDQKFIDLAIAYEAMWLFSRDKALLRLARRAVPWHVRVLHPAEGGSKLFDAGGAGN